MSGTNENARHPDSTFATEYPYNQATVTRGGHEFHVNDALGKETLKVAHTSGTYVEIENTGRWVQVITEKCYSYIMSSLAQTVDQHADYKVGGNYALNVDGHYQENVRRDKNVAIGGDYVLGVGGVRFEDTVKDKYEKVGGNYVLSVDKDYQVAINNDRVTTISGNKQDTLEKDWSVTSKGSIEMQADGDFRIKCKRFIVNAGEEVVINTAAGPITITASGNLFLNGAQVRIND